MIRHFGLGLFIEVLRAPPQATFLEILARWEFNTAQKAELRVARQYDLVASRMQREALSLDEFSLATAARLNQVAELLERVERSQEKLHHGNVDPLLARFELMLSSLAAKEGPVKEVLGTLSKTELMAVESRVLRATQKRCRDEIEARFNHAHTELDLVRAHLVRLFQRLNQESQTRIRPALSEQAAKLVT